MQITNPHGTLNRLTGLIRNLREIKTASENNKTMVELSKITWICPISFLPIVTYADYMNISLIYSGDDPNIITYLEAIHFPNGTCELASIRQGCLPITRVSCADRNDTLSAYEDRILEKLPQNRRHGAISGLKYLTSELEANVREHAQIDDYWIFAQYWERSGICEIGICDTGIGYKQSYRGTQYEVARHIDAILNALKGKSSKSPHERGAGIPTVARILDEGYEGELIIMSGDSLLLSKQGERSAYRFNLTLPGAFVGLRFGLKEINIYNFIG